MKDKVLSFLFAGIITITSPSIFASGIPVVDVTAIAKTVEEGLNRAAEAARQLEQLKQQYEQTIRYAEEQKKRLEGFTDFSKAKHPAIGDPASVPAGQYAKEALTKLGQWDGIQGKVSLGTNVTQVLNWVAEGSADTGLVYATDAALLKDKVTVVAEAPAGSLKKPVIYPIGVLAKAPQAEAAKDFAAFLQTEEAMKIFAAYGFAQAK